MSGIDEIRRFLGEETDNLNDSNKQQLNDSNSRFTQNQKEILGIVAKGNERVSIIAKNLSKDRGNVARTLKVLTRKDLIYKDENTKSYYPTRKGIKIAIDQAKTTDSELTAKSSHGLLIDNQKVKNLRIEDIGIKIKIKKKPKWWGYERRKIFEERGLTDIRTKDMKNWQEIRFKLNKVLVKTSDNYINVVFPKNQYTYRDLRWEVEIDLMQSFWELKGKIEHRLGIKLDDTAVFTGLEVADIDDIVANALPKDGFIEHKNYIVWLDPKTKKIRLKFDRSPGNWEMEYAMAEWSVDDAKEILRRRADEAMHPHSLLPSEMSINLESLQSHGQDVDTRIVGLVQTQELFKANISTHIQAIQKLGTGTDELVRQVNNMSAVFSGAIEDLRKEIKKLI